MKKLKVTCECGRPITKSTAAKVLRNGQKPADKSKLSAAGKKGAAKRWGIKI